MGIFSLFGKKEAQQQKPADKERPRSSRPAGTPSSPASAKQKDERPASRRPAPVAAATVLKIDAIESEMSSEFVKTAPTARASTGPGVSSAVPAAKSQASTRPAKPDSAPAPSTLQALAPDIGDTTAFLLNGDSTVGVAAELSHEATAVIEECAILYANGQTPVVEQMLRAAIAEDLLEDATRNAWWMLFDLLQLSGEREAFEQLAVEYANKFEASPPGWSGAETAEETMPGGTATPTVAFSGALDAQMQRNTERVKKLAETYRTLRLEFVRISGVDEAGCQLLLALFRQLQKSGHNLVLVGARELADKVRAMIAVGQREGEDCWLLLLEILRLLNAEKEFEEASIDYCVTFEVSPPAFVPPQSTVTTATEQAAPPEEAAGYRMPVRIEGRVDNLVLAIAAYSDNHNPAIIDCSALTRVDFDAAGRLLSGLAPFCGSGKTIEFHHVNHLVAELFNVIGLKDIVRIVPRKA